MNKIILLGNMTRNPKTTRKTAEDGNEVVITKFDLAVNRRSKRDGESDMMQYYPVICKEEAAIEKICELIENLPEVGIIGKVPEKVSTELLLRELDPGKNIFSDDEKSLIREYGLQMKDERKTRELAEKLCSRDMSGNQDAALVIQEARDKLEEKRLTPNTTPYIL